MGTPLAVAAMLWPTPGAADGEKGPVRFPRGNPSLGQAPAPWRTPRAPNASAGRPSLSRLEREHPYLDLQDQAAMWRSEEAPPEWRADDQRHSPPLSRQVLRTPIDGEPSSPSAPTSRRRLNPQFVEWLMGWPIGWTGFEPLGTEWSHWWRLSRSWLWRLAQSWLGE